MFLNAALAAVVLSTGGLERLEVGNNETQRSTIYMAVVLWSVAGLSAFRFCGAVWFLVVRLVSLDTSFEKVWNVDVVTNNTMLIQFRGV